MKLILFLIIISAHEAFAQQSPTGIFEGATDIGAPAIKGSTRYEDNSQTYYMQGGGFNIWFNRDEFQYAYKKIKGDFILTANFAFVGPTGNGHRKIGWMARETLDEGAASMNAVIHGDGLTVLQWREMRGAYMRDPQDEIFFPKKNVEIVQLERAGKQFIMRVAHPGEPLQEVGSHDMPDMRDSIFAGIYICSHDSSKMEEAKIWNVRIDRPVPNDYHPNPQVKLPPVRDVVGCRMEIINVADGRRKVILESAKRFEAPNWMPDGKRLLFNQEGGVYTLPVDGGPPERINTGALERLNNDHLISFNGKWLGVSAHRRGMTGGGSSVYVLPLTGGEPKLLTDSTPSYLHGWNPNNQEMLIVAQRNGGKIYNIYKVSVVNGAETAVTNNTSGHVDGPEYSPDGKYIYYNANPTGTMQIWRMKADGTAREQLTFDEYHNWFPHISPDGKWIAYISFGVDIDPADHPFYKRVTLRVMPAAGGAPRVIAYLYGGQGTLNVNSWAPDSRRLAFVSNSEKAVP